MTSMDGVQERSRPLSFIMLFQKMRKFVQAASWIRILRTISQSLVSLSFHRQIPCESPRMVRSTKMLTACTQCVYIHTSCFTITATRATRAIRKDFIRSLIRQDISYFDSCTPGSVATSISNNADLIQGGLSEKVGTALQGAAMLGAAFVVAFTRQWKLTLVVATSLPGAVLAVGITVALDARLEAKILDIYSKAGGLVEESLGSIRIVTAFGASRKLQKKYDAYLEVAKKFGVKKGPILGKNNL
jgi:ABC-type multidrug transport system fused ATPase/permease subunit